MIGVGWLDRDEILGETCTEVDCAALLHWSNLNKRGRGWQKRLHNAIHIASSTICVIDYLLTWNRKHIANAQIQGELAEISLDFGCVLPILCTPNELMGD